MVYIRVMAYYNFRPTVDKFESFIIIIIAPDSLTAGRYK